MVFRVGTPVANTYYDGVVTAVQVTFLYASRIRNDGIKVKFCNGAHRTVPPETLKKLVRRECCNYCMWFGPVNADDTMRRHHPAREGSVSGERKIQDRTKPVCEGSNKPFATFH